VGDLLVLHGGEFAAAFLIAVDAITGKIGLAIVSGVAVRRIETSARGFDVPEADRVNLDAVAVERHLGVNPPFIAREIGFLVARYGANADFVERLRIWPDRIPLTLGDWVAA